MPDYAQPVPFLSRSNGRWTLALRDDLAGAANDDGHLAPRLTVHANPNFGGAHGRAATVSKALEGLSVRAVLAAERDFASLADERTRNDAAVAIQHTAGDIAREPLTRPGALDDLLARPGALDRFGG